jgi:hypothetical protein
MNIRYSITLTILTSLVALGCQRLPEEGLQMSDSGDFHLLEAFLENGAHSRTSLGQTPDGSYKAFWSEDDDLGVVVDGNGIVIRYTLEEGANTSRAVFKGPGRGTTYEAVYPSGIVQSYSKGAYHVELPQVQLYTEESFAEKAFPMYAKTTNGSLQFKNLCSVLKITLKGKLLVNSVKVSSMDEETPLSGPATIENGELRFTEGAETSVRLNKIGARLSETRGSDLYIVVPAQRYPKGLAVTIYTDCGYVTMRSDSDLVFGRSELRGTEITVNRLDVGTFPSERLVGNGTEESPFLINNLADFLCFRDMTHFVHTSEGLSPLYFRMTSDISLNSVCGPEIGSWNPVPAFQGFLEGDGHTVSDLYIDTDESYSALFYQVGADLYYEASEEVGTIRNLTVEGIVRNSNANYVNAAIIAARSSRGIFIRCVSKGEVQTTGYSYAGGIVGYANHSYSYNDQSLTSLMDGCRNEADIISGFSAGGIIGYIYSGSGSKDSVIIRNCENWGDISLVEDEYRYAGGIAGFATNEGSNELRIYNCFNAGTVSANYGRGVPAGIVSSFPPNGILVNCYNFGEIVSTGVLAGIAGVNEGVVQNCYNAGLLGTGSPDDYDLASIAYRNRNVTEHCYWLYDEAAGLGTEPGVVYPDSPVTGLQSMTKARMQGDDLPDMLNGWVDAYSGPIPDLCHWIRLEGAPFPLLAFEKEAHSPDWDDEDVFHLDKNEFLVDADGGTVKMTVASGSEYSLVSIPEWVTILETRSVLHYDHEFYVLPNPDTVEREGSIVFKNASGMEITAHVRQKAAGVYYSEDFSRDGHVTVLQDAVIGAGVDLVLMGDGFSDRLVRDGSYGYHARLAMESFFEEEPFKSYRHLFNVYQVDVISENEGYEPGGHTALEGTFGEGTKVGGNINTVESYVRKAIPAERMDDVVVVVFMNSHRYAGTCYFFSPSDDCDYGGGTGIAFCPIGPDETTFGEVVRHEAGGHGFGKLGDEYGGNGPIPESEALRADNLFGRYGWYGNVDFIRDPAFVRWADFIYDTRYSEEKIGIYEGGFTFDQGVFRPSENSIMRYNTGGFNAPSRKAIWYKIHRLAYGAEWIYDFENFVRYDTGVSAARSSARRKAAGRTADRPFVPLGEPVIIDKPFSSIK